MALSLLNYYDLELKKAQRLLETAEYLFTMNKQQELLTNEAATSVWESIVLKFEALVEHLKYHNALAAEFQLLTAKQAELDSLQEQQHNYIKLNNSKLHDGQNNHQEFSVLQELSRKIVQLDASLRNSEFFSAFHDQELRVALELDLTRFRKERTGLEHQLFRSSALELQSNISPAEFAASHIDYELEKPIVKIDLAYIEKSLLNLPPARHPNCRRLEAFYDYADYADFVAQQAVVLAFKERVSAEELERYVPEEGTMPLKEIYKIFDDYDANNPNIISLNMQGRDLQTLKIDVADEPLFRGNTLIPAENQGENGDCWLLAAVRALIEQKTGIKLLAYSMRDLTGLGAFTGQGDALDGKVLIRVIQPQMGKLIKPTYLLLDKAYFATPKAVVGEQLVMKLAEQVMAHLVGNGRFEDLNGGEGIEVFHRWLGYHRDYTVSDYNDEIYFRDYLCKEIWKADVDDPSFKSALDLIFKNQNDLKDYFMVLRKPIKACFPFLKGGEQISRKQLETFKQNTTQMQLSTYLFQGKEIPVEGINIIVDTFISKLAKHANLENNVYDLSVHQGLTFQKIEEALKANKVVLASTYQDIGEVDGVGYSGNEALRGGIAALHEYAVVGTNTVTTAQGTLHYVRVANPWGPVQANSPNTSTSIRGSYFAIQQDENGKTTFAHEATDCAEFNIPIREFTNLFKELNVVGSPEQRLEETVKEINASFIPVPGVKGSLREKPLHLINPLVLNSPLGKENEISKLQNEYNNLSQALQQTNLAREDRFNCSLGLHQKRRELLIKRHKDIKNINVFILTYSPALRELINFSSNILPHELRHELWLEYKAMYLNPSYQRTAKDLFFYAKEGLRQIIYTAQNSLAHKLKVLSDKIRGRVTPKLENPGALALALGETLKAVSNISFKYIAEEKYLLSPALVEGTRINRCARKSPAPSSLFGWTLFSNNNKSNTESKNNPIKPTPKRCLPD